MNRPAKSPASEAILKRVTAPADATVSASDRIVTDIVRGLYDGRCAPGQRLVEPDLMQRYGVGRSTVREAIKRLSAVGIAAAHPFRGAQIRQLSGKEARDTLLILELMIGLAARLAAANIGQPGRRRQFNDVYRRLLSFADDHESYEMVLARDRFYRAMTCIGDNAELVRVLPNTQVHLVRTHLRVSAEQRLEDYRGIGEAVLDGDEQAAETAARRHIRRSTHHRQRKPPAKWCAEKRLTLNVRSARNSLSQWATRATTAANPRRLR